MSHYSELNELYMEKAASPELLDAVRWRHNVQGMRDENLAMKENYLWTLDGHKAQYKQRQKVKKQAQKGVYDRIGYKRPPFPPQMDEVPVATNTQSPVKTPQQSVSENSTPSIKDRMREWKNNRRQVLQEKDNQRIDKEYRLQQAKKNPSFRADAPDPKTQDQSFWSAVRGNKPQGGDQSQTITPQTSVLANPNNQSSLGSRMLSWGKSHPAKAAGYGLAAATAVGAAAYGVHKMRQLKKKQEQEPQQSQYNQPMQHTASESLNELYMEKMASVDVQDAARSIPQGVQDDASMIEKIQESVKYTKKEDVPGGKSAPSKLVQRKNKERFKK